MVQIILHGLMQRDELWEARTSFNLLMVKFKFHLSPISIIHLGSAAMVLYNLQSWTTNYVNSQIAQSIFLKNLLSWSELKEHFSKQDCIT